MIELVQQVNTGTGPAYVSSLVTSNFPASVTEGHLLVVVVRTALTSSPTVSDTLGTTFTLEASLTTDAGTHAFLYSGVPSSSGTNAVTASFGGSDWFCWVLAAEFSPVGVWTTEDANAVRDDTGTDLQSDPISTSTASVVVLGATQNDIRTYTAGTDFTLLDGTLGGNDYYFGGVEAYYPTGALTDYVAHITTSASASVGVVVVGAFSVVETDRTFTPPAGTLLLSGKDPACLLATRFAPESGAWLFEGNAPALNLTMDARPATGTWLWEGQNPSTDVSLWISPETGVLQFAGLTPPVFSSLIPVTAGELRFSGFAPFAHAWLPVDTLVFEPGTGTWQFIGTDPWRVVGPYVPTSWRRPIRRLRQAPHLSDEQGWLYYDRLQLDLETGVGLDDGQGIDPQLMLQWSDDGGQTWSREHWVSAGRGGAYTWRAIWRRLGRSRDRVFRVVLTDPVKVAWVDAYMEIERGTN